MIDLLEERSFHFGDLIIGTYNLDERSSQVSGNSHSLVIEYSSVPATGTAVALLGARVVALAIARRRLG